MNVFHVRYTCSGELQSRVVTFITKNAQKFIVSKEIATREHIQCYVETKVTKKTWSNKVREAFKELDRRDKYCEPDSGRTKWYVCKGENQSQNPIVLAKRGFTDEDITMLHNDYWKGYIHEEIQDIPVSLPENLVEKAEKTKKKRPPTFMKQIRLILEDEYPDKEWSKKDRTIVYKKVMYCLGEQCKALDHIIVARCTYGVLNSLVKDKKEWLEYWHLKAFGDHMDDTTDSTDIFTDSKYIY